MLPRFGFVGAVIRLLATAAWAGTVDVPPGAGTLQAAIDAAPEGATLRLHSGTYAGAVTVNRPKLRLRLVENGEALIDAGCAAPVALDITADGVKLLGRDHGIVATGGTDQNLRISGRDRITLIRVFALTRIGSACSGRYSMNIESSTNVKLVAGGAFCSGCTAGLRLGSLSLDANVRVVRSAAGAPSSAPALLLENCAPGAGYEGAGIQVKNSSFDQVEMNGQFSAGGTISFVNTSGAVFSGSLPLLPGSPPGLTAGTLSLDASSNDNIFNHCSATTLNNNGSGNCGSNNQGFSLPPCP